MSADLGQQRKTSTVREDPTATTSGSNSRQQSKNAKETKTMADSNQHHSAPKPDFQTLINLVHSSDIQACSESATALREMLLNGDAGLLIGLLSQYVQTNSEKLLDIIAAVRHPLDKVLLDQLTDIWRVHPHACLKLVSHLVLKQVPWLLKFPQHASFGQFLKTMRSSSDDISYCIGVALILASVVLLTAPLISPNLAEIFNAFLFLAGVLQKKTPSPLEETPDVCRSLLYFRFALYALFQRLYGLFPCHFLTFLRQNFAGPQTTVDNRVLYQEIIRPMLDFVKLHPLLVTANKEGELAKERWIRKEIHDIMAECNRVAGDPYENYVSEDPASSLYFRPGFVGPPSPSTSNFLTWSNSFASRPTSSIAWLSNKPTPVKDGSSIITPKAEGDSGEKRQLLIPITLPSVSSSSASILKSTSTAGSQQQISYWSPSDAVGLSTPPENEENETEDKAPIPEMRTKHFSERSRAAPLGGVLRKTSMAAGPETPAPHTRSFRTGSWGAEARQKFLQNRQQQNQLKQQQSSLALLEPDRKPSMARRSFGQAFAKLFNRPSGAGTSSVPPSPSVHQQSSFDFDFGPAEFRPTTSNAIVRQFRENSLSQQPELAEEADEACTSSATGSIAPSRNGAGSLVSSKRPSLSEPLLCPDQPSGAAEEPSKRPVDPDNTVTLRNLSAISKTLTKENDENLLEDAELQRYWANAARQYTSQLQKRQSFSSSRTSSSIAVISAASGDRTRHLSSAAGTSGVSTLQGALSRHSSLLDTQAVAGLNERSSMTPPVGNSSGQKAATSGEGDDRGSERGTMGFTLGAPDDNEEDEEVSRLRSSTNITDASDSVGTASEEGGVPRLSTSHSLADFISRINRMRFDSRCLLGEEIQDESAEQSAVPTMEMPPNVVGQPPLPVVAALISEEFRRRGSTFSGVMSRPMSCPPGAHAILAGQSGRKKQTNAIDRSVLSDDVGEKDVTDTEESRAYDALFLLTRGQIVAPPAIPVRQSPYQLLDDYMAAAISTHTDDHSWPAEAKEEASAPSSLEKTRQSPDVHAQRKASTLQKKISTIHQSHPSTRDPKDVAALKAEIQSLQTEIALCKQRVFYERHQRLLHAERNRRLYGRLKQATALDEQNQAQRDQIRLQENEINQLTAALSELRRQNANQRQEYTNKEFQLTSRLQAVQRENETHKSSFMASKRTADDLLQENIRLKKELGSFVQKLFDKEAAHVQLQEQCAHDLPATKHNIAQLNKELFLMGESNSQLRRRIKAMKLRQDEFESLRERLRLSEETAKQETNTYRRLARKERHKSDAAFQRVQELEALLQKRQSHIAESKRRLEQASDVHQEQMAACQMKYTALMTVCQRQESHILELYDKVEAKHMAEDRRKNGLRMMETSGFPAGDNHSNGGNTADDAENMHDGVGGLGLDIPYRTGTSSEIRSYDSYHSASYLSQHIGSVAVGPSIMSASLASAGSVQSSDLYLPYLFKEFHAAQQQQDQEGQETVQDQVDNMEIGLVDKTE